MESVSTSRCPTGPWPTLPAAGSRPHDPGSCARGAPKIIRWTRPPSLTRRTRGTPEQTLAALEAQLGTLKARAERERTRPAPMPPRRLGPKASHPPASRPPPASFGAKIQACTRLFTAEIAELVRRAITDAVEV